MIKRMDASGDGMQPFREVKGPNTPRRQSLRLRYIIALTIVACATITGQIVLTGAIKSAESDAAVINTAGRQRMLSQRIALTALQYALTQNDPLLAARLAELIIRFERAHQALLDGDPSENVPPLSSTAIRQLIQATHDDKDGIVASARNILEVPFNQRQSVAVELSKSANAFLPNMDKAVGAFQEEAESKIHKLMIIERGLAIATLLVLLAEALLVFEPAVRMIRTRTQRLFESEQRQRHASQAKSSFIANISHEVRTPMNAIVGYAEELEQHFNTQPNPPARMKSAAQNVRESSFELLRLIDNVLDLHDLAAAPPIARRTTTHLKQLLLDIEQIVHPLTAKASNTLSVQSDENTDCYILIDPALTAIIVRHIFDNVNRRTSHSSISFHASIRNERQANQSLMLEITETGGSSAPRGTDQLFNPFAQDSHSTFNASATQNAGEGIGLALAEAFVDALDGSIELSEQGSLQTQFHIIIPAPHTTGNDSSSECNVSRLELDKGRTSDEQDHPSITSVPVLDQMTLLVAEDNFLNADLAKQRLTAAGAEVTLVSDGASVLSTWDALPKDHFDAILLDIQMPVMDGYLAAQKLRSRGCDLPIIAVTAYARSADRERCLSAGCDAVISKPLEAEHLISTLATHRSARFSPS